MKLALPAFASALALVLAVSAQAADTTVTLTDAHLCCGKCENAVAKAVKSAGAKAEVKDKKIIVTAADAAEAQKAADALVAAGFWFKSDNAAVSAKDTSGVKAGTVTRLELTGVHSCCGKCAKAVHAALDKIDGVKAVVAEAHNDKVVVEGSFDAAKVVEALHATGLHGKVKE